MPRRAKYNRQGTLIMGFAAYHTGINSVPELAERTGIPYQRLYSRMSVNFGQTTVDELRAIFRVSAMTEEEIGKVLR